METIFRVVAGLDIGKKLILACRRRLLDSGKFVKETASFGATKKELERLVQWLNEWGVTHIAMEATGVYWKPIWNVLETSFEIVLVNPQHIKKVPGRKTDVKDCEWIAQLMQHGLLKGSFVPPKEIRRLRDLTRTRFKFIREKVSTINRIHKVLEDANIKLGSVATDIMGVSGMEVLRALSKGITHPIQLASSAHRLHSPMQEIVDAVDGYFDDHHRFQLEILLRHIDHLDSSIERFNEKISQMMVPYEVQLRLLQTHPAVKERSAQNIIAEIGVDMTIFPTDSNFSSWAGVAPGNDESAGKRKNAKTTKGDRWLKAVLTEISWASSRTKRTFLRARYNRLAPRRGKKRAICALNHTNAIIFYHMLKNMKPYQELGVDYYTRINPERTKKLYIKKLQQLGYTVQLIPT